MQQFHSQQLETSVFAWGITIIIIIIITHHPSPSPSPSSSPSPCCPWPRMSWHKQAKPWSTWSAAAAVACHCKPMTPTTWDRWGGAAGGWLGLLDKVVRLLSPWLGHVYSYGIWWMLVSGKFRMYVFYFGPGLKPISTYIYIYIII